jgi:hypothetical protein
MERYRYYKNLSGKEVAELFKKSGVSKYILECFGALHTVGEEYLISEIGSKKRNAFSCPKYVLVLKNYSGIRAFKTQS